ncbi:hypothetical protein ACFOLC_16035 [Lysobacter cavernae]|uniref:C4-dicarboxylate ABC transporter n=1 Tax=Lysobacter cavernae TaxID=1685901 RepID=A0ABV7RSN0_9GAMM
MRKLTDWIGALICVAIVLRAAFYLGAKAYFGAGFDLYDWVAIPIGMVAAYIGYMYLHRIFGRRHVAV